MLDPKHDRFLEQLKADLAEAAASLDRGEGIPWREVHADLVARIDARAVEKTCGGARCGKALTHVIVSIQAKADIFWIDDFISADER